MGALVGGMVVYSLLLVAAPQFTIKATGVFAFLCIVVYTGLQIILT